MTIEDHEFASVYDLRFQQTTRMLSALGIAPDLAQEFAQGAWTQAWQLRSDLRHRL